MRGHYRPGIKTPELFPGVGKSTGAFGESGRLGERNEDSRKHVAGLGLRCDRKVGVGPCSAAARHALWVAI